MDKNTVIVLAMVHKLPKVHQDNHRSLVTNQLVGFHEQMKQPITQYSKPEMAMEYWLDS